jgi:flagellar basal-body rod modification protein FlgD
MSDIPISYITNKSTTSMNTAASTSSSTSNTLDKDGFLKLLIAQLQNQDPSSPMDSTAMMQQTTQLSMMEQLTNMADTSSEQFALQQRMAAADLVGKQVAWTDASAGTSGSGVVTAISYASTTPTLTVGGTEVSLPAVTSVTPVTA